MSELHYSMHRRDVLAGGMAISLVRNSPASAQTRNAGLGDISGTKVIITLGGAIYSYPDGPKIPFYFVDFKEDGHIVFHLGALGDPFGASDPPKPYHLGSHEVRIERNGVALAVGTVSAHWWNAQWTFRPKSFAATKTPAQIVAAHRLFAYGDTGVKEPAAPSRVPYAIMGSSSITKGMPTTGERPDIGLITDNSAYFMLGGDPSAMFDWALAAGSCPIHFRDEATGKPIDLLKYPLANCYGQDNRQGMPWFPIGPIVGGWPVSADGWQPQQAHWPEMSYVAYQATGDPGFLADLQNSATFTIMCDAYVSGQRNIATITGEYRGVAWALRNLFMAHVSTKDAEGAGVLPNSCHPSSYWKTIIDNQLLYYSRFMAAPANQQFHLVCEQAECFAPWQVDYMLTVLAFAVLAGHGDWVPLYLWALKNVIDRTSAKSGWPPAWTGYYVDSRQPDWRAALLAHATQGGTPVSGAQPPDSEQRARLDADPLNGGSIIGTPEYMETTRAVLVMADYLDKKGLANVRRAYPDFDICLKNTERLFQASGTVNLRISVVSS